MSSFPEQDSFPGGADIRGRGGVPAAGGVPAVGGIPAAGVPAVGDIRGRAEISGLGIIPGAGDIRTPAGRPDRLRPAVDVEEASRQLELAAHDIAVASSCIGLGDLDEAHTNVITARAATDAAEEILRVVLASGLDIPL